MMKPRYKRPRPKRKGRFIVYLEQHELKNRIMKVTKREKELILLTRLNKYEY